MFIYVLNNENWDIVEICTNELYFDNYSIAIARKKKFYQCTKKFKYVLLSRFSQDALENLFSMIRRKNLVFQLQKNLRLH